MFQFLDVFYRKDLERQIRQIKHKLSAQSSSLFPDFQNKLMFLQELKYINADNVGRYIPIKLLTCNYFLGYWLFDLKTMFQAT